MTIYNQQQIYNFATQVGLSGNSALTASAIAMAESGGNSTALNPGNTSDREYSVGLWQINLLAHPQYSYSQMIDPLQNAKAMSVISNGGTYWGAWSTYNNRSFLEFMSSGSVIPASNGGSPSSSYAPLSANSPLDTASSLAGLSSTVKTNPVATSDVGSGWSYILAYLIATLFFIVIAKFQVGYNAIYYLALLFLMLIFVVYANSIANSLKPLTDPNFNKFSVSV